MKKLGGGRTVNRRKLDEQLSAYIDGELGAANRARLEAQLATNPSLRAELAALQRTVALVQELPPVAVPRNFLLPHAAARQPRVRPATRPRLAWTAPLLTAASTVVSLLFVVALAGNLFATAEIRPTVASDAFEAPEERAAAVEEAAIDVEAEAKMVVTAEVEAPVSAERSEEKAAAPVEEVATEEGPAEGEVERDAVAPADEEPEPALAPADEAVKAEAQETEALGAAAEQAGESYTPAAGTLSAEEAEGSGEPEAPVQAAGGAQAPTAFPRSATAAAEPPAEAANGDAEIADDEAPEQSPEPTDAQLPAVEQAEPSGGTPEREPSTAPPETEPAMSGDLPQPTPPFPWRAAQVGLGSAAFVLIVATIWAWRLRR
jgi:anti-sigma factor RsiW